MKAAALVGRLRGSVDFLMMSVEWESHDSGSGDTRARAGDRIVKQQTISAGINYLFTYAPCVLYSATQYIQANDVAGSLPDGIQRRLPKQPCHIKLFNIPYGKAMSIQRR